MKVYLVIGANHMGEANPGWGICGLFKTSERAWACLLSGWIHKTVVEIETDFFEDEKSQDHLKEKPFRMLRPE